MHSRGTPETMQDHENLIYDDLITTIFKELEVTMSHLREEGIPEYIFIILVGI